MITELFANGEGASDILLNYRIVNDIDGQEFITANVRTTVFDFGWRTSNNIYSVESRGSTVNVDSVVTICGVTFPTESEQGP